MKKIGVYLILVFFVLAFAYVVAQDSVTSNTDTGATESNTTNDDSSGDDDFTGDGDSFVDEGEAVSDIIDTTTKTNTSSSKGSNANLRAKTMAKNRDEYKQRLNEMKVEYKEDHQFMVQEMENILEEIESGNLTEEEKALFRAQVEGLREQRKEVRTEYHDTSKGLRVEYRNELRNFLSNGTNRYKMSNGRSIEVKIMPEVASDMAIRRLKLKNCNESNNCTIEFKEIGNGENKKLAYSLSAQKQGRFLGLFKTKMDVESEIDAETGEVLRVRKPWWAFLVNE